MIRSSLPSAECINHFFISYILDKIIVGSFHGVLRIFNPKSSGFNPSDLMVETQLPQPILHVASGKFAS